MSHRAQILQRIEGFAPLELAARWPADRPLIMLHSGRAHPRWARWSILTSPAAVYRFDGRSHLESNRAEIPALERTNFTHDPLIDLNTALNATRIDGDLHEASSLPFRGGWIGCFSYDLGRLIEPAAQGSEPPLPDRRWPLVEMAYCPGALVLDNMTGRWHSTGKLELPDFDSNDPGDFDIGDLTPDIDPDHYMSMVARTLEYIAAGDIFQANIAQRLSAPVCGSIRGLAIEALRRSGAWYGAYIEQLSPHSRALLSLSPELFLQIDGRSGNVITRPIKGTRPGTVDVRQLIDSAKDAAELHMIVDLMRNDLGRICEVGSIRVPSPRSIETHPTVHHGVAEISGRLRKNVSFADVLRATFPGGSVTGAPKIRAMQIIDELEPVQRGPYCGAIGCISDCGNVRLNIAIRTAMLDGASGTLEYFAGAGIVADSQPLAEYREVLAKAAVLSGLTHHQISEPHSGQRSLKSSPVMS